MGGRPSHLIFRNSRRSSRGMTIYPIAPAQRPYPKRDQNTAGIIVLLAPHHEVPTVQKKAQRIRKEKKKAGSCSSEGRGAPEKKEPIVLPSGDRSIPQMGDLCELRRIFSSRT